MNNLPLAITLSTHAQHALAFQSYAPGPVIDGVWQTHLEQHFASNGCLMEIFRLGPSGIEGLPSSFVVRQLTVSVSDPARINAFHVHVKRIQNELWTVLNGRLLVWLVDLRKDSPTEGVKMPFVLTAERPAMLHIPAGVAHGYRAGVSGATLLYASDQPFNQRDPDEGRLPWDMFGPEIWNDDRG